MSLSMNWISDFVDFTGLDKVELIHRFSLSTAEVENEIFFKGSDISGIVVAEIKSVENHPDSKKLHLLRLTQVTVSLQMLYAALLMYESALKQLLQKLVQR